MEFDDILWRRLNHEHCSHKVAREKPEASLCRNEFNVTGLCTRSCCPLANGRYATVLEREGVLYLYIKVPERAHSPKHMWQKVKLPRNFLQALDTIGKELAGWPDHKVNRAKQRLTKLRQLLIRTRQIAIQQTNGSGRGTQLVPIKRKQERREASREVKAEAAAKVDLHIENELVQRLKAGVYGSMYKFGPKASERTRPGMQTVESARERSSLPEFVSADEVRDMQLEEEYERATITSRSVGDIEDVAPTRASVVELETSKADVAAAGAVQKVKKRRKTLARTRKNVREELPRIELEYELET